MSSSEPPGPRGTCDAKGRGVTKGRGGDRHTFNIIWDSRKEPAIKMYVPAVPLWLYCCTDPSFACPSPYPGPKGAY